MLWVALAFLVGDVWVQLLPDLTRHSLLLPVYLASGLLALSFIRRWPGSTLVRLAIVAFLLGLVWAAVNARLQLQQDLDPALEGEDLQLIGHISSMPETESYGVRFIFTVEQTDQRLPQQLELTWYAPIALHAAERWQFTVRLKRRHGFANPGGYD